MEYKNITLEKKDGITKLTINRPPVNIIDCDTMLEMIAALEELSRDEQTGAVLIRGSGDRAFCAGVEVKDHLDDKVVMMMNEFARLFRVLRGIGKPTIAVVNGVALGGGCELVAGCDLAIAAENAQLGQPEIKLGGLAPAAAAMFPSMIGIKKAFELIVVGDNISASEAERIGLVNKVVPAGELDSTAEEYARKLLGLSRLSVKLIRDALYQCADAADFETALQRATDLGTRSWQTADGQEGLHSFLEKRAPVWKNE